MATSDEQAILDSAIDQYERALDMRDTGDDEGALALVEFAQVRVEELYSVEAAIARARFAITRAELATRVRSPGEAIDLAVEAVNRAKKVARDEPLVEASAVYMLGKAERPSPTHRHGATSFERSLALFRKLAGDASRYTVDAAAALATAYIKLAEWQRASTALELVFAHAAPDLLHVLQRATAGERLGNIDQPLADIEVWLVAAATRPAEEQLRGHLCASRVFAVRGDATRSAGELAHAFELARDFAADDPRRALLLEGAAWYAAVAASPEWPLAGEVLIRRAAALAWSAAIADTAWRIAALWRYGVEESFIQPTFAAIEVEACLEIWDTTTATYAPRPGHQQIQLVVAGAPTTIERLADDRWRDLCVQRIFSAFHAELFKAHEPSFVAPVHSTPRRLGAQHVLEILPSLRIPKWATANTVALTSLGEIDILTCADFAALATRTLALAEDTGADLLVQAVPTLDRKTARALLAEPGDTSIAPASSIPLIPGS